MCGPGTGQTVSEICALPRGAMDEVAPTDRASNSGTNSPSGDSFRPPFQQAVRFRVGPITRASTYRPPVLGAPRTLRHLDPAYKWGDAPGRGPPCFAPKGSDRLPGSVGATSSPPANRLKNEPRQVISEGRRRSDVGERRGEGTIPGEPTRLSFAYYPAVCSR